LFCKVCRKNYEDNFARAMRWTETHASVSQVKDGPWLVVDETKGGTLVASCPSRDVALMIAALMNGNPEAAIERRKSVVLALNASLSP
jgi:hypothetical protein